jgi:hypothetical protein
MSKIYEQVDDALDFLDGINAKDRATFMAKYLQDKKGFSTLTGDFQDFLQVEHGIEFNVLKNRQVTLHIKGNLLHTYADFESAFRVAVSKINNPLTHHNNVSSTWRPYSSAKYLGNEFNGRKPFIIVPRETPVNKLWAKDIEEAREFIIRYVPDHKLIEDGE